MKTYILKCTICNDKEIAEGTPADIQEYGHCELKTSSPWRIYRPTLCPWKEAIANWKLVEPVKTSKEPAK